MIRIDGERLMRDLRALREFGAQGTGVVRTSLSAVDLDSREWLMRQFRDAGLEATIDGVGTVYGRSRAPGRALVLGSHTDTQPMGGWLDGVLGVAYGLEVARALAEHPETRSLAVDVASWNDEEGAYHGFLGSRSFCGTLDEEACERAMNIQGESLRDALARAGYLGRPRVRFEPGRHLCYIEAHIEQGPRLEMSGNQIGVVTGIVGIRDYLISVRGEQNHAGTTPMDTRRDAGGALIDLAHRVRGALADMAGPATVWNIGRIGFEPGAESIVPGYAEMTLQMRDSSEEHLDAMERATLALVEALDQEGRVRAAFRPYEDHVRAVAMEPALQDSLARAAATCAPDRWMRMSSAAGHDAQVIATRLPCSMLFVPSIGGISHDFREDTAEEDIVLGCQVLANAVADILLGERAKTVGGAEHAEP